MIQHVYTKIPPGGGFLPGKVVGVLVVVFRVWNFSFGTFRGGLFASSLTLIVVFFRVANFRHLIER